MKRNLFTLSNNSDMTLISLFHEEGSGKRETRPVIILTKDLCDCRVLEIPPVKEADLENLIQYKLLGNYPGDINEIKVDFIREGNKVVVFFMKTEYFKQLSEKYEGARFISPYHLLLPIKKKHGIYKIRLGEKEQFLVFKENRLLQYRISPLTESEMTALDVQDEPEFTVLYNKNKLNSERSGEEAIFLWENPITNSVKKHSLFRMKRKRNLTVQLLLLITLLIFFPQFHMYRTVQKDQRYLERLENRVKELSSIRSGMVQSQKELDSLMTEYQELKSHNPPNLYTYFSDLYAIIGRSTEIENLTYKGDSFQFSGKALDPLRMMEGFSENRRFQNMIPNQIQPIEESQFERFSISGSYSDE